MDGFAIELVSTAASELVGPSVQVYYAKLKAEHLGISDTVMIDQLVAAGFSREDSTQTVRQDTIMRHLCVLLSKGYSIDEINFVLTNHQARLVQRHQLQIEMAKLRDQLTRCRMELTEVEAHVGVVCAETNSSAQASSRGSTVQNGLSSSVEQHANSRVTE